MRQFKRRTIALVLASVVTVVGAFGTNNYKNSLMGLSFDGSTVDNVKLTLETKSSYQGNISPIRRDANTYVLMLPEINSLAPTPDLSKISSSIASVNIRTMPYSNNAKGYTRITIKTHNPSVNLSAEHKIYVGSSVQEYIPTQNKNYEYQKQNQRVPQNISSPIREARKKRQEKRQEEKVSKIMEETSLPEVKVNNTKLVEIPIDPAPTKTKHSSSDSNAIYLWLWAILIVMCAAFFYTKAQNKMQEIAGEKINIELDDKPEKQDTKNNKKLNKIKNTINTLDSAYSKTSSVVQINGYANSSLSITPAKTVKPSEELNIVDLDELFQEHKIKKTVTTEEAENEALEDFLSGFSFVDHEEIMEEPETLYNEELYEKTINNSKIKFSKDDIACINKLLDTEINDDTRRNINQYAISSPVIKTLSKEKFLENLVTTYTISQNISFKHEDIKTLNKLIHFEIDKDFITDLRTNPQKTLEMEKDILSYGDKPKKPSEIITLSVKDMLPDLSEALKRQGNKKIESNKKAETIYFSEGYEVSTLSIKDSLPDLSIEIKNKNSYKSKPTAEYVYVDTNYSVGDGELKIASELPDLKTILANPEKNIEPKPKESVADESVLLENINNVVFKPFYDGTNDFEVLNDFNDTPSVADIQKELNQFEGFEITQEELEVTSLSKQENFNDLDSVLNNYIDLDNPETLGKRTAEIQEEKIPVQKINSSSTNELIKKIEATRIEREKRKAKLFSKETIKNIEKNDNQSSTITTKCILDGETYTVISSANISEDKGFYLAKCPNNYAILSFVGSNIQKLKEYETVKSEKIHARLSEKMPSGTLRYLIRIGLQKIVVNVKEDSIEYVMDLC